VSLFTIHASGGSEMMQRAVEAVAEVGNKTGVRSKVLAISVLTSIDANILAQIGVSSTPSESVIKLVKLAESAGVDGVVASPQEIETIRDVISNPNFLVVTPGAISAGASYLVVGRPITGATDPVAAAQQIIAEMRNAESLQTKGTVS
jgi:orotidine-5'-phosphate decarboxylase